MDELLEIFRDIDSLKHREREGWKKIGVEGTRDTIASHSFGAAMMAWVLGEREGFDTDRLVKMLLMHDLVMAYVDDYTPEDEGFDSKREEENQVAEELIRDVPEEIRDEFRSLFQEFQAEETRLASFARECDKLETILQAYMYSRELGEDRLSEFIESYRDTFESYTGRQLLDSLENSDVTETTGGS
ncbi:MAG: HD family hydrolase [Candidatus Nanohaloarchaea archaeon]